MTDNMALDPTRNDMLILVDALDRPCGFATKEDAHRSGKLHRAFSVVLTRETELGPEILLAKRALCKYHSGGLWANSCCSHPRVEEDLLDAAYRRVREELGCDAVDLREIASFVYHAPFQNGICEHEFDHVLVGTCTGDIVPDPTEASEVKWVGFDDLARDLTENPRTFAVWVHMVLSLTMKHMGA